MVDKFWQFIRANKERIERMHESLSSNQMADATKFVKFIGDELSKCCPGLVHEFGRTKDGVFELIISADGLRKNVDAVKKVVRAAPKLEGWRIIAFRPRTLEDVPAGGLVLNYEGRQVDPARVWYSIELGATKPGNLLHIESHEYLNRSQLLGSAFILLDMAIGEYDVMTKLGHIDAVAIGSKSDKANLKPLKELAGEIDRIFPPQRH